ncbi:hypothetical protein H5410_022826 [Solanum commersonii]|uniref:Uncharacterized protein n=1 Tax=Solanum commersonii TaxID=4109 RepID=A0A9J5ZF47_SOLCO|nr:hypothetical protein H5410_022826 [Solanum commersonii]
MIENMDERESTQLSENLHETQEKKEGRGTKCDSSLNFNLEEDTLSVVLTKALIMKEDALSVVRR